MRYRPPVLEFVVIATIITSCLGAFTWFMDNGLGRLIVRVQDALAAPQTHAHKP